MAAPQSRVYVVPMTRVAVTAAITLIQILAGATCPLQVLRSNLAQSSSTTSTQLSVQVNRKSAAATVTDFAAPNKRGPANDVAALAVGSGGNKTGTNASAEGTDTTILAQDVWNYLNGWQSPFTPKDYPFVDATGIIGLKLPVAPGSSVTITADVVFEELA